MNDYYSRKQKRVNRGAVGAELNNQLEGSELGMIHCGFWHQELRGRASPHHLHENINGGRCDLELHMVADAHAVFVAVTASEVQVPNEKSSLHAVRALRDRLESGALTALHRCDTRDMLCDALTKGGIARKALVQAFDLGRWRMLIAEQVHRWRAARAGHLHAMD